MVKKTKKDYLNTSNIPRSRREFQDYDYIKDLPPEEKEWLAKFTTEYYGADFEISNTYMKTSEAITLLSNLIGKETNEKKKERYKVHLDSLITSEDTMTQISNNKDKTFNIDLRKARKVDKYYKQANGAYTMNKRIKYTNNNIHSNEAQRKLCNEAAQDQQADMFTQQFNSDKPQYAIEKILEYDNNDITALDPEQLIIFMDEYGED